MTRIEQVVFQEFDFQVYAFYYQVQASEYNYLFNFNASVETPQAIVSSSNIIKAVRPIPKYPNPTID